MTLRPQPRRQRRAPDRGRPPRAARRWGGRRRGAGRPGAPLRARVARRLPSLARATAVLGALASAAALVGLIAGPWLRVSDVAFAGHHHTDDVAIEEILASSTGTSILAVDTRALADRIEALPAVADASVRTGIPGRVEATVVEHEAAFVWHTRIGHYLGAPDGTVFALVPASEPVPEEFAELPAVTDRRAAAWTISVGDRIPDALRLTAMRILDVDPAAMGSTASDLGLRLDDAYGFRLLSSSPEWEVALGAYGLDPAETDADAAARLERQIGAVRTLFAERDETEIAWVDVRNPAKVYFRAKG
jgi:cell division protein FtsQ